MIRWHTTVRVAVGLVGLLIWLGALVAFAAGQPLAGVWAVVSGGVLLFAAIFEVGRYRGPGESGPKTGFQPTDELFDDPSTGQRMRVWFDPRTGERRYEPEA